MATRDITFERGLPANADAEQLVLGAIMLDDSSFVIIGAILEPNDFSLEKHKRIFNAMLALNEQGERIDRVTVANELMRRGITRSTGPAGMDSVGFCSLLTRSNPVTSRICE